MDLRPELFACAPDALASRLKGPGRAHAVYAALRRGVDPFHDESIPKGARARLDAACRPTHLALDQISRATDGTTKLLYRLHDERAVEAVLIPTDGRTTLCISSQVGCARGCTFCLTATMLLVRDLTASEIIAEVVSALAHAKREQLPPLRNLVFMGMGEPLDNLPAVREALAFITGAPLGLGFGRGHITVSTVGPSPKVVLDAHDLPANFAWSLHAADDTLRRRLVPTQRHTVESLRDAFATILAPRKAPLFVEMTLLDGVNDHLEDADRALHLFRGFPTEVRFNLLPMNAIPTSQDRPSTAARVEAFALHLRDGGHFTTVRKERGADESAACGQLAVKLSARSRPVRS